MPRQVRLPAFLSIVSVVALLALVGSQPVRGQEDVQPSAATSVLSLNGSTELVEFVSPAQHQSESHLAETSSQPPQYELVLVVNQERISRGIPPLRVASELANAAQSHSDWMADHDCFAHDCPGEPSWTARIEDAGYLSWTHLGESIAGGFASASAVVSAWMNSAPHRSQLLDPQFCDAGGGYAYGGATQYHHYWTLDLGSRKEQLPVVLIHGWHGPDAVRESQFKYMTDWLEADDYDWYYATGITADRSLQQNAPILKDYIDSVKREAHASRVILIGHSRGGLVARAYVESDLYEGDVDKVIMLGTPNKGATLYWTQLLLGAKVFAQHNELWPTDDNVSSEELIPENMARWNEMYRNGANVPYYLIGGDAFPCWALGSRYASLCKPNDYLASVESVHWATGNRNVYMTTPDVHGWDPKLLYQRSYVNPRDTYDACIRPALAGTAPQEGCQAAMGAPTLLGESSQDIVHTPYQSGVVTAGEFVTVSIPITASVNSQFQLVWEQGDLDLSLLDPLGTTIDPSYADSSPDVDFIAFEPDILFNYNMYDIADTIAGTWTLTVTANYTEAVDVAFTTFATLEPTVDLDVSTNKTLYDLNEAVFVTATLSYGLSGLAGGDVEGVIGRPDLVTDTLMLHDDGGHGDGLADDGVYGNIYGDTDVGGPYTLFVTAEGMLDGVTYARADEVGIQVSPETGQLTGSYSGYPEDADNYGRQEYLVAEVEVDVTSAGDFLLSGILLGPGDEEMASTVRPVTLSLGTHTVPVRFEGDLIYRSGVDGPYTLTQVFLMDSTGLPIKLDEAYDAWVTPAYDHRDFGLNEVVAVPLALKRY